MMKDDIRWLSFWDPENSVGDMWKLISDIILDAANTTCPFVNMKIANNNPEWFSHELPEEIHLIDELFREYSRLKTDLAWDNYKIQRNRVKSLIKNGKEEFVKDQIDSNSGNPKKFWHIINNTTGLGKERANVSSITLVDEHKNLKKGIEAVEFMNNYYASAGFNLLNQFKTTWQPNIHLFDEYPGFKFSDIYEYEVTKSIKEISIAKLSAYNEISMKLFKDAFSIIIRELTFIFNKCLSDGIFRPEWELAEVTPIPKTGDLGNV